MTDYKSANIFISIEATNSPISYINQAKKSTIAWYQLVVQFFINLAMHLCIDLTYSVGVFSWFCSKIGFVYIKLVKYVL